MEIGQMDKDLKLISGWGKEEKEMKAIAAKILADYKEHYDFPPQGESHMEDCIMDALQSLSLESVRSEARNAALEEAARECGICASRQVAKHDQKVRDQTRRDLAAAIRALQSPARVAEGKREEEGEFGVITHSTELRK